MRVIDNGHRYELENFDAKDKPGQALQFIKKTPKLGGSGEFETVADGTTNEDVLHVLIDRLNVMQMKLPCRENAIAMTHLETALLWLEFRTKTRIQRGVEGKYLK
jgi:hypothetical protein